MSKSEIDLLIKERENLILRVIEIDRLLNDAGISQENSSNLKGDLHQAKRKPRRKFLPPSGFWWYGTRFPTFRKPFICQWIKVNNEKETRKLLLQAAYVDRYGNVDPRLADGDKSPITTYRHGKGEYLHASWVTVKEDSNSASDNVAVLRETGLRSRLNWPHKIRPYEPRYQVNDVNVNKLVERLRKNESLRIFLSSPFNGAREERDAFMNIVFPALSKLCGSKSIHLSVVDLRWGITSEMSNSHQTVLTCLSAIDKSDIFLGYFGARYGSSNYSTNPGPNGRTWIDDDVDYAASFPQYRYIKEYGDRSITEMEFLHAITHDRNYEKSDKPISFVCYRDPRYDERLYNKALASAAGGGGGDPSWYVTEKDSAGPLMRLKTETRDIAALPGKYMSVFDDYPTPQLGASLMHACCESLIREALKLLPDTNVGKSQTYCIHSAFARSRLKLTVDFDVQATTQVREFIRSRRGSAFLLVSGESGGGKSTFMADLAMNGVEGSGAKVVFYFTGCTSESCSLRDMLHSIYFETTSVFRPLLPDQYPLPDADQIQLHDMWPTIIDLYNKPELSRILPGLVVVLDAVNQLRDEPYEDESTDLPSDLKWLPTSLHPRVRLVISCLPNCRMYTELVKRTSPSYVITLGPLGVEKRKQIVIKTLGSTFKAVDESIMSALWESSQCSNAMFLTLALNFLISHGSYEYLRSKGVTEILASRDVPDLLQLTISKITDGLHVHSGGGSDPSKVDVIEYILCAVYCSRVGLTGGELVQYLRQEQRRADGEERPDHVDSNFWVRLEILLHLFISPRRGMFNFTHDFVRQAVERKYFGKGSTLAELESALQLNRAAGSANSVIADLSSHLQVAKDVVKSHHQRLALFFQILAYSSAGVEDVESGGLRVPTEEARFHQKQAGLRPSVTVAIRVRPLVCSRHSVPPSAATATSCIKVRGRKLYLVHRQVQSTEEGVSDTNGRVLSIDPYDFDYILDSSDASKTVTYASQSQVYKCLGADIVSDAIEGTNVTVIAYGQTSSGKSYTMFGPTDDPGLIPRTVRDLLTRLTDMQTEGWTWKASCTMVEVYKDKAYDLLDYATALRKGEVAKKKELQILCTRPECAVISDKDTINTFTDVANLSKAHDANGGEAVNSPLPAAQHKTAALPTSWNGAVIEPVETSADIDRLLELGTSVRTTLATGMNDTSSRSHCIFTVYIEMQSSVTGESRNSKMHLVDLAGSERVTRAGLEHIQESISINTSLSALNACIRALSDPSASFVPFRRSTLTWFLQDSLGGSAKTVFLATVSPSPVDRIESQNTLKYATFAKQMAVTKDEARQIREELKRAGASTAASASLDPDKFFSRHPRGQLLARYPIENDSINEVDESDSIRLHTEAKFHEIGGHRCLHINGKQGYDHCRTKNLFFNPERFAMSFCFYISSDMKPVNMFTVCGSYRWLGMNSNGTGTTFSLQAFLNNADNKFDVDTDPLEYDTWHRVSVSLYYAERKLIIAVNSFPPTIIDFKVDIRAYKQTDIRTKKTNIGFQNPSNGQYFTGNIRDLIVLDTTEDECKV